MMQMVKAGVVLLLGAACVVEVLAGTGAPGDVGHECDHANNYSDCGHDHGWTGVLPYVEPAVSELTTDAIRNYGITPPAMEFNPYLIQRGVMPWSVPSMVCFSPDRPPSRAIIEAVNRAMVEFLEAGYQPGTRWSGTVGTPRNLTWSFVPDGTSIPASSGLTASAAPSNLFSTMDSKFAAAGGRATWIAQFQSVFDRWAALTGTSYTRITTGGNDWDDGAALHGSAGNANRGDIRISGRSLDGVNGVLAYNFFPSSGDMVIDTAESWGTSANTYRFLRNTLSHEHGHGLGLEHVCPITTSKLMEPFLATNFDGPQHDDIRAIHSLYGDAYENNGTSATATPLGALSAGGSINPSTVPAPAVTNGSLTAISNNGDVDFFSFTTAGSLTISVTVTPLGSTYDSSPQNTNGSCASGNNVNSLSIANLSVEVLASNGTTVLGSATANAAGVAETISNLALASAGTYYIRVFEANSPTESQLYTLSLTAGAGCTGASVASHPSGLTRCTGTSAAFSVTAAGTGPFNYQWRKGVSNIVGATLPTYTISSVVVADAGNYNCVVTNSCGTATSNSATLTVDASPTITLQPVALARCVGTSATFTIAATGPGITYLWLKDGAAISGATGTSYTINPVVANDEAIYSCLVSNSCEAVLSDQVSLTVNVAPSFNASPAAQAVCVGSPVTFTASAVGSPAPALQWRKNGVDIGGATGTSYTIPSVIAGNQGTYDCVATNSCTSVTSGGALLTVNDVPQISLQPSAQGVCEGQPFSFSVAATTTVTYQWRKDLANISGATGPTLAGTAAIGDAGSYDCVLTNSCGSTTSNVVGLTVNKGPEITTQPTGSTVNSGSPAAASVVATGSPAVAYQWRRNSIDLSNTGPYTGTDTATLNISAVTNAEAGSFDVVVTNTCGTTTSDAVVIDVASGCPADLDNGSGTGTPDGGIDINDLLYFLNRFEAGAIDADLDNGSGLGVPDGGIDINDLLFFLAHFEGGC